jgi:hypothetical protein
MIVFENFTPDSAEVIRVKSMKLFSTELREHDAIRKIKSKEA